MGVYPMRTLSRQDALDPSSLLYYAPRRLRERIDDAATMRSHGANDRTMRLRPAANGRPNIRVSVAPNFDNSLVETPLPESLRRLSEAKSESSHPVGVLRWTERRRLALAVAATVITAVSFVVEILILDAIQWQDLGNAALNPLSENRPAPTLAVADDNGTINMALPFGVYETSTGAALDAGQWPAPDADRSKTARLQTPVEMALPFGVYETSTGAALDAGQWPAPDADRSKTARLQSPAENEDAATGPKRLVTVRQINPSELTSLLKRAEALVSTGDLPAARLLLNRLAEAHNARAAFDLAATYDPTVIKALGAVSASPDLALARTWYERARDWGSTNASEKLHALENAPQSPTRRSHKLSKSYGRRRR
jgi:hypothetical protein